MDLKTLVKRLNEFADKDLACDWDNVGLLVEPSEPLNIKKILVTNDLTEPVLNEAIKLNVNLIIAYHPAISAKFPLTRLTQSEWKQRIIVKCIEKSIAVYSPHTTWDAVNGGINDAILNELGAINRDSLTKVVSTAYPSTGFDHSVKVNLSFSIKKDEFLKNASQSMQIKLLTDKVIDATGQNELEFICSSSGIVELIDLVRKYYDDAATLNTLRIFKLERPLIKNSGLGRSAELIEPRSLKSIVETLKSVFNMHTFRVALAHGKTLDDIIKKVAVAAGGAGNVIEFVKSVDLLITGELLHRDILQCIHNGISLIVTDHTETERCFLPVFKEHFIKLLSKYNENVEIILSTVDRDPLFYI